MKPLFIIIKREYLSRIKKKSFIILTLLMPILFVGIIFVPLLLSQIKDSGTKRIAVIDTTGKYAPHLQSSQYYAFEPVTEANDETKAKVGGELFGILQITGDLSENPKAVTFLSKEQAPMDLTTYIDGVFSEAVKQDKLQAISESGNIDPQIIANIRQILDNASHISVTTLRWQEDGSEKETSTAIASGIGFVFTFLMYMFILMYGAIVMNGVVEEKSNRIVEVMISSVRPFDLMMGKIIGIGLTGLTQLLIWIAIVVAVFNLKDTFFAGAGMSEIDGLAASLSLIASINWLEILIFFLLLFIGGYLIYASLFSMFGAAVDSPQDTQQFMMPITLIFIFAIYAAMYSVENPNGPLAFWCSMIPLTSPIVMMVRIPFGIPLWEELVSLVLLYATIFFVVKFAAKIYRVGILMYGKKPNLKEMLKWFTYK
jgi:ABC-2 type transport system permease protein